MAKRTTRRAGGAEGKDRERPAENPREAAVDALLALMAERRFAEIGLDDIAERAGLSLAALRAQFPGRIAILAAFSKRIDEAVLASGPVEGEGERDRLFDILMRRFDALAPYREALRRLSRAAARNPALACAAMLASDRSMKWMLAAARVRNGGFTGRVAASGAGVAFAQAMTVWLNDAPDNERTMATLDRALRRGERGMIALRDACDFVASFAKRRRGDRPHDADASSAA